MSYNSEVSIVILMEDFEKLIEKENEVLKIFSNKEIFFGNDKKYICLHTLDTRWENNDAAKRIVDFVTDCKYYEIVTIGEDGTVNENRSEKQEYWIEPVSFIRETFQAYIEYEKGA